MESDAALNNRDGVDRRVLATDGTPEELTADTFPTFIATYIENPAIVAK